MNPLTHPRRGFRAAVLLVAAALALTAACSGDDDGNALADTESVDSSDSASGSGDSGSAAESGDNAEASEGAAEGDVLGTTRAQHETDALDSRMTPLRIDLTRLERHGDLVEVTLQLTNEAEMPTDDSEPQEFAPYSMFGDGRYDVSDVGLVDGAAQKLYLAIIDSEDVCLCTTGTGSVEVPPGDTWTMKATIGGVPDDVEQVDVSIPGFPTIAGVGLR